MTSAEPKKYLIGALLCDSRALLPVQLNGHLTPLVCSAVEYLQRQAIGTIILLDHEDSIIAPALVASYPDIQFARSTSDYSLGIPVALMKMALAAPDGSRFVVVHSSQAYPLREIIDPKVYANHDLVVVRDVEKEDAVHLAKWHQPSVLAAKWVTSKDKSKSLTALASPWLLSKACILSERFSEAQDVTEFLNKRKIKPWRRPLGEWRDFGAREAYLKHWAGIYETYLKARQLRGRDSAVEALQAGAPELQS